MELGIISVTVKTEQGRMYRVKSNGPSTEPCSTPY